MKRFIPILLALLAAQAPALGQAAESKFTVLLAGGVEANEIHIWLTPDGREYVIDSVVALEVGGSVCVNPADNPNELLCEAPMIAGFEVNADGGDDRVSVANNIEIPVTLRGGNGNDSLTGGSGSDKLIGGNGNDRLVGRHGDDALYGGLGRDLLVGGPGADLVRGGPGPDTIRGGTGPNKVRQRRAGIP
jgi:Ca2+-binding RTX toxin-like protein